HPQKHPGFKRLAQAQRGGARFCKGERKTSEWISPRLFHGEYDELREGLVNGSGGRSGGCADECLSRIATRNENSAFTAGSSDILSCAPGFSEKAFDDSWELTPEKKHRQSSAPMAYSAERVKHLFARMKFIIGPLPAPA